MAMAGEPANLRIKAERLYNRPAFVASGVRSVLPWFGEQASPKTPQRHRQRHTVESVYWPAPFRLALFRSMAPSAASSFLTKSIRREHGIEDSCGSHHPRFVMDGLAGSAGLLSRLNQLAAVGIS